MTSTKVKSGQTITGTAAETAFDLQGPYNQPVPTVTLELLTGSYSYTTVPNSSALAIADTGFTTISTANDKKLVSWTPGLEQLRIKGVCTIHVSY